MVTLIWSLLLLLLLKEGDGNEEEEENAPKDKDGKPIRDPAKKLKALQEQVDRLATKLDRKDKEIKERDERIRELEEAGDGDDDAARDLRLENAFLRSVLSHEESISDWETVWDLATARDFLDAVKIADDGTVEGMDDALSRIVERYPWIVGEPASDHGRNDDDDGGESPPARTRQPKPASKGKQVASREALERRFPALRRRRRHR